MKTNRPAIIILIFVGLVIVWFAYGAEQIAKWRFYNFKQDRWSSADQNDRWFMAKYLVDKKLLIGKTKDEVVDLLGPAGQNGNGYMSYRLKSQRYPMIGVAYDWLELMFDGSDPNNIVAVTADICAE